ncbi:hypothetical protein AX16_008718 [Volvariella volvacea WC 439]|nr:hypothetical protein AX16_008718 [Volvariella volvacea WC 439]
MPKATRTSVRFSAARSSATSLPASVPPRALPYGCVVERRNAVRDDGEEEIDDSDYDSDDSNGPEEERSRPCNQYVQCPLLTQYPNLPAILQEYINNGLKQKEIPAVLLREHQIKMSLRSIQRIGQKCKLKTTRRSGLSNQQIESEVFKLLDELENDTQARRKRLGSKSIRAKLRQANIHITRDDLKDCLRKRNPLPVLPPGSFTLPTPTPLPYPPGARPKRKSRSKSQKERTNQDIDNQISGSNTDARSDVAERALSTAHAHDAVNAPGLSISAQTSTSYMAPTTTSPYNMPAYGIMPSPSPPSMASRNATPPGSVMMASRTMPQPHAYGHSAQHSTTNGMARPYPSGATATALHTGINPYAYASMGLGLGHSASGTGANHATPGMYGYNHMHSGDLGSVVAGVRGLHPQMQSFVAGPSPLHVQGQQVQVGGGQQQWAPWYT